MKFLFDQNISFKITTLLNSEFPESQQVRQMGLENKSDIEIFDYTKEHDFSIVTFDSDFVDLNIVRGIPPKIIWLKTGNLTTKHIAELLKNNAQLIQEFLASKEDEILEIIKDSM